MKRFAFAICVFFALSLAARAQQSSADKPAATPSASAAASESAADAPATKEDVEQYFVAMHSRETLKVTLEKVAVAVQEQLEKQFKDSKDLTPEAQVRLTKVAMQVFREVSIDDYLKVMEPVIERTYTQAELKAMVAFYSTPTGQNIQKKQPVAAAETLKAITPMIHDIQEEVVRRSKEEMAKIKKEQEDVPKKG